MGVMTTPANVLSALLDPTRLIVAGALVSAARTTEELAVQTGLDRRAILEAVGSLRQAGLVEAEGAAYRLPPSTLHELAKQSAAAELPMDPYIGYGMNDEERRLLARFFQGRTLTEIPAGRAKRRLVLERLSLEFDLGHRYDEAAVNETLRAFHPDYSTLRRYLVDEGFLDRERGQYWRIGGRFEPPTTAGAVDG